MIGVKMKRKKMEFKLIVEDRPYADMIFKICPINMLAGDTLQITCITTIQGYTNGKLTSSIEEKWEYMYRIKKKKIVKYVRFTKWKDKGNIQIYYKLPKLYTPKRFNALKIK